MLFKKIKTWNLESHLNPEWKLQEKKIKNKWKKESKTEKLITKAAYWLFLCFSSSWLIYSCLNKCMDIYVHVLNYTSLTLHFTTQRSTNKWIILIHKTNSHNNNNHNNKQKQDANQNSAERWTAPAAWSLNYEWALDSRHNIATITGEEPA